MTNDNVVKTCWYDSNGRFIHKRTVTDGLVLEAVSPTDTPSPKSL